ncbi:MAG: ABC transporter ATP-binding protein [Thiomonas sp.]|uniref:ABC transporter ATP-binding protein n=1 Tax=Thiomonas sp. TaxID=2047785 RepID=UPI002A36CCCA|nr:ABC transporter ATP-binding protein [Thiomonas sp.]MDY0329233.1 ABC transporter ATP-binding protein [Thiomonas sp.]
MLSISVQGLTKRFPNHLATDDLSLDIEEGQFVVVLGPSGCGKTTLLRLIAGFEQADAGRIHLHGREVTQLPPGARDLGMVFQSYALFPHLSVADNLQFGLQLRRVSAAERKQRLEQTSALLGLDQLLSRKPAQLSGGQQQRVALGRAIIGGRRIILMDEPLSNLDAKLRQDMRREIKALAVKLGITVVYATHDQAEALSMGDVVVVMHEARIVQVAVPATLYERPNSLFVARFIGSPPMNLLPLEPSAHGLRIAGTQQPVMLPAVQPVMPIDSSASLTLGIRPEHLWANPAAHHPQLLMRVDSVEYQGSDSIVNGHLGPHALAARLPGRAQYAAGQTLPLGWSPQDLCLFDPQSGKRLDLAAPTDFLHRSQTQEDAPCNVVIS